MAISETNGHSL